MFYLPLFIQTTTGEDLSDFVKLMRNKFKSRRYRSRPPKKLGYLPVQTIMEGSSIETYVHYLIQTSRSLFNSHSRGVIFQRDQFTSRIPIFLYILFRFSTPNISFLLPKQANGTNDTRPIQLHFRINVRLLFSIHILSSCSNLMDSGYIPSPLIIYWYILSIIRYLKVM